MKFSYLASLAVSVFTLLACQSDLSASELPMPAAMSPQSVSFNDVTVKIESCEITPERSAVCILRAENRFTNKRIEVDRRITIQDNFGSDYAVTAGGFGNNSARPQWNQVAVADSSYQLTVIARNFSTRATAVRAVIFPRLLARSAQGQTPGYRDQVIFSKPRMVVSGRIPPSPSRAPPSPSARPPMGAPSAASTSGLDPNSWQVIGLWDYDATDGESIPNGFRWRPVSGGNHGARWPGHLELQNHASLRPRTRALWPAKIHPAQRKVCANYPGYPTYSVFVDLPGEPNDGVYLVSECAGE